eukprot:GHRR01037695.1.p1 GENE.GHRR01037695.1~~GHRR01037695.1.p1  ORF type:complete len:143 (-),score=39.39 GHRR01037695.1:304-732(-)
MGERPEVPVGTPEDYSLLICSCWDPDPQKRPTFEQVVRCLEIMITSRQQELVEAKSGSSLVQNAVGSGNVINGSHHQAGHAAKSCSSGEFDLVINTRANSQSVSKNSQLASRQAGAGASGLQRQGTASSDAWMAGPFGPKDL